MAAWGDLAPDRSDHRRRRPRPGLAREDRFDAAGGIAALRVAAIGLGHTAGGFGACPCRSTAIWLAMPATPSTPATSRSLGIRSSLIPAVPPSVTRPCAIRIRMRSRRSGAQGLRPPLGERFFRPVGLRGEMDLRLWRHDTVLHGLAVGSSRTATAWPTGA